MPITTTKLSDTVSDTIFMSRTNWIRVSQTSSLRYFTKWLLKHPRKAHIFLFPSLINIISSHFIHFCREFMLYVMIYDIVCKFIFLKYFWDSVSMREKKSRNIYSSSFVCKRRKIGGGVSLLRESKFEPIWCCKMMLILRHRIAKVKVYASRMLKTTKWRRNETL